MTITGPTAVELEEMVRRVLGPALDVMQSEVEPIRQRLLEEWPVKTGRSRDAWEMVTQIDPDRMRAGIELHNPLVYVRYIKTTKEGRRRLATRVRSPLQTEVRRPMSVVRRKLRRRFRRLLPVLLQQEVNRG